MTHVVLVSGKGGVGKTTLAAATAVRAAELGHRSLVVSLDRAHSLGSVLNVPLGAKAVAVPGVAGLDAVEADPQVELDRYWRPLGEYGTRLLQWAGLGGVEADEVAIFPGLEELLLLSRLIEMIEAASHDLVVVDLAPTASSMRLLTFPELEGARAFRLGARLRASLSARGSARRSGPRRRRAGGLRRSRSSFALHRNASAAFLRGSGRNTSRALASPRERARARSEAERRPTDRHGRRLASTAALADVPSRTRSPLGALAVVFEPATRKP